MTAIVYDEFMDANGWPITQGEDLGMFFSEDFYRRNEAVEPVNYSFFTAMRIIGLGLALGLMLAGIAQLFSLLLRGRND